MELSNLSTLCQMEVTNMILTTYDKDLYEKTLKEDAKEEGREEGLTKGRAETRSFFFEKWLLTHVFGGSRGQKSSCKQACIGFLTF